MEEQGNEKINSQLEAHMPPYYRKPNAEDPQLVFCSVNFDFV